MMGFCVKAWMNVVLRKWNTHRDVHFYLRIGMLEASFQTYSPWRPLLFTNWNVGSILSNVLTLASSFIYELERWKPPFKMSLILTSIGRVVSNVSVLLKSFNAASWNSTRSLRFIVHNKLECQIPIHSDWLPELKLRPGSKHGRHSSEFG